MARFTNLHHVGEVLGATLSASLDPPLAAGGVMVGPPLDNANSPSEHVRLSLMWVERQAGHESDPWEREADGTRTPPPLSLSAYYLVTCYGTNSLGDPERGHELLGSVLRIFHRDSRLELPLAALPGRGEGGLGVDLVQTRPELIEKLFAPLQLKHRPFALYEVGPVQLVSRPSQPAEQCTKKYYRGKGEGRFFRSRNLLGHKCFRGIRFSGFSGFKN